MSTATGESAAASTYSTLPHDPLGPKYCDSMDFRYSDPFCPNQYRCQDMVMDAEWFVGQEETDFRHDIDLESGSMDHLPDVRPYLYYMGYWGHWELEGASAPPAIETMKIEDVEYLYVRMGRDYLCSERKKGRGYYWGPRDRAGMFAATKLMRFPYVGMTGTLTTDQDVGLEDYHDRTFMLDVVMPCVLKTNIRAILPNSKYVKVKPGDADWDCFVQWLYNSENHGIDQAINIHWNDDRICEARKVEAIEGRFLTQGALIAYDL